MTTTIAVAGKGGTGKTSICALMVKLLAEKGVVLAIDGDPSSNLHLALGLPLEDTVGGVREEMLAQVKGGRFDPGMAKQDYIDLRIHESLVESEGLDLLAMGRPEGPGCYCAANNMLRNVIDRLETNYAYVVIDNEAGLEHISRQTTADLDMLLIVSDVSMRGMVTAARVKELIGEIRTSVGRVALVINRLDGDLTPEMEKAVAESGLELVSTIPTDPQAAELDSRGLPLVRLPDDSPLMRAVRDISEKLGLL